MKQIQPSRNSESYKIGHQLQLLMIDYMKLRAPDKLYLPEQHLSLTLIFEQ